MKLTISNIAWQRHEDPKIAKLLADQGITAIEVAPTKVWDYPLDVTLQTVNKYLDFWHAYGIRVSSLQALLFGRPELQLFGSGNIRQQMLEYLKKIIKLGGDMGAEALVFGSPKNRLLNGLSFEEAKKIAVDFFYELGQTATKHGTCLCIEPNPVAYGCDFITDSLQAHHLVSEVAHPGFALHLDAAAMTLSQENVKDILPSLVSKLRHFHISEVNLALIGEGSVDHPLFNNCLKQGNYTHWLSIEMRANDEKDNYPVIETVLNYVQNVYI